MPDLRRLLDDRDETRVEVHVGPGRAEAAVDRLSRIVAEGLDSDAVNAARVLLDAALKYRDHAFITDRLADLEATATATATVTTPRWPE